MVFFTCMIYDFNIKKIFKDDTKLKEALNMLKDSIWLVNEIKTLIPLVI